MDRTFSNFLEEVTPKFNKEVVEGLPKYYLKQALEYIDRVFKIALTHEGLTYLGYTKCTPEEEYYEATKLRNNKRLMDLSKSDIYLIKFNFEYKDFTGRVNRFSKCIFLPYIDEGGIMHLKGVKIHIVPVLNDKVITPSLNSLFVRLLKYRIKFFRLYHTIVVDGKKQVYNVIWSNMYNKTTTNKLPITTKAVSCVTHYLLGKYGFDEAFQKFCGFIPIVTDDQVDRNIYTVSDYMVCTSTQVKPKTFIDADYTPSKLSLIIPRELVNDDVMCLISEFFYMVDHFPDRIRVDMLNNVNSWRILLGHILFSGLYGENKLLSDINSHFESIDTYVDSIVIEKLEDSGYNIKDFYELVSLIAFKFNEFTISKTNNGLNIFGKSLEVLYYVLYGITSDIFKTSFKLSKPNKSGGLTCKNVVEIFNKTIKLRGISSLTSNKVCAEIVSYSGDNMYPKLTSKISEQENSPNSKGNGNKRLSLGADKHFDPSMLETGSILFLPKSNPTPICKINPYINIDLKTGVIKPHDIFNDLRKDLESKLKMPNN